MKISLIFLGLLGMLSFAQASVEENCCFCIADPSDRSTTLECQRWLKDNRRKLDCSHETIFASHKEVFFESGLSCRKVAAYGANHGLSYYYSTVFNFASKAAKSLKPTELSYDGSTCLVFNNTKIIESQAQMLSLQHPNVSFNLVGNQNLGVVKFLKMPIFGYRPVEIKDMSSKMIVKAEAGFVEVEYGECSRPRRNCGYSLNDIGATTDSNEKICRQNNELTTQKCCKPEKGNFGKWGIPGMGCEVS